MAWVIASLLIAAMGFTQWVQGGHHFAVLAWPAAVAAGVCAVLAAAESVRELQLPRAVWGLLLLALLAGWGWLRWLETGAPGIGFLPVVNLSVGVLVCGAVLLGLRAPGVRLFLTCGIIFLAAVQMLQVALWRVQNHGLPELWLVEQLRVWYPETNPRLSGTFINRNHLVWVLNTAAMFTAALCVWARIHPYWKFLCGWLTGIFTLGTLLALSRGGALGLGGGLSAFLLLSLYLTARSRGKKRAGLLILLGVLSAGVLTATGVLVATNFLVQDRLERVGEDFYREQTWQSGVRQFQLEPLVGTGPGSATDYARIYRPPGIRPNEALHLHNDWLQLAAEGGWIALAIAVLALFVFLALGISGADERLRARPPHGFPQSNEAALAVGAVSALVGMAVHSFFDFNLQLAANSLLAYTVLGIAGLSGHARLVAGEWWRKGATILLGAGLAVGAALFLFSSKPWFDADLMRTRVMNSLLRNVMPDPLWIPESPDQLPRGADGAALAAGDFWNRRAERAAARGNRAVWAASLNEALRFYRFAAQAAPLDRFPRLQLAAASAQADDFREAYLQATSALDADPLGALVYEYIGGVCEMAGDWQQARRAYGIAQSVFRNSPFLQARRLALEEMTRAGTIPPPGPLKILPERTN